MSRDVIWADEDETVQQVLLKMQQNGCGYVLTGKDGIAEGVVSRTDVAGAMSPYLRSVFSRWRRVQDDATLEIKVKWLMSRPVRSLREDAPLSAVVEGFMRYGGGCMPVIGHDGKIIGIITMLDVVRLSAGSDEPTELSGRAIQTMIGVPG